MRSCTRLLVAIFVVAMVVLVIGNLAVAAPVAYVDSKYTNTQTEIASPVTVLKLSIPHVRVKQGAVAEFTYNWHGPASREPLKVSVHFVDLHGTLAASDDHYPTPSTTEWAGVVSYSRIKTFTLPKGEYKIWVALTQQGEALPLTPGEGVHRVDQLYYQVGTLSVL